MNLSDIDGRDDLKCPVCGDDSLEYINYTAKPTSTIGEMVSCDQPKCRFYAEAEVIGSLPSLFKLLDD